MAAIYRAAVRVNDFWFRHVLGYRWQLPPIPLDPDGTYLVIANHQSWADSFLIQSAVVRQGPILKVLVKSELMRFPVLALIFWAYDFPRLKRRATASEDEPTRRRQDADRIRAACATMRHAPAAILVYPEGTRFTAGKHAAARSPYQRLLPPRPGGFSTILDALHDELDGVLDLGLSYPQSTSFWRFLSGSIAEPEMQAELFPVRAINAPSDWLQARWREKDAWLTETSAIPPGTTPPERHTHRG
jgi:1-acyl-sn-glycerol-3-phosphate acyltransferase